MSVFFFFISKKEGEKKKTSIICKKSETNLLIFSFANYKEEISCKFSLFLYAHEYVCF
jgi:hypothetical protein